MPWDESKHPRHPKGSEQGGEFRAADDGGMREYLQFIDSHFAGKPTLNKIQLEHGRAWPFDKDSFIGGKRHQCYANAFRATLNDPSLTYVEGYVSMGGVPISHAWVVDKAGKVRDVTIKDPEYVSGYYGVPIKQKWLNKFLSETKTYGVFDWMKAGKVLQADPKDYVDTKFSKAEWDESKHPRRPKGSEAGGEFTDNNFPLSHKDLDVNSTDPGVVWHGTSSEYVEQIMRDGLRPGSYLTNSRSTAEQEAEYEVYGDPYAIGPDGKYVENKGVGGHPVLLAIQTKSLKGNAFRIDDEYADDEDYGRSVVARDAIPAKVIVNVTEIGDDPNLNKAKWDESKHPRHPKGSERGGEFTIARAFKDTDQYDDDEKAEAAEKELEQFSEAQRKLYGELRRAAGKQFQAPKDYLRDRADTKLRRPELDKAIGYKLPQDVRVFRGVWTDKLARGSGYVSVTTSVGKARDFAAGHDPSGESGGGVIAELVLPKGTKVAFGKPDEYELVLPYGTKLARAGRTTILADGEWAIAPAKIVKSTPEGSPAMAKEKASPKDYDEEDLKDLEFEDDEAEELEEDVEEETKKGWDESKHPRHPKGSEAGGEFAPKEGVSESRDPKSGATPGTVRVRDIDDYMTTHATGWYPSPNGNNSYSREYLHGTGWELGVSIGTKGRFAIFTAGGDPESDEDNSKYYHPAGRSEHKGWKTLGEVTSELKRLHSEIVGGKSVTEALGDQWEEYTFKAGWDESKHPRHPAGSSAGGEFRSGDKVTVHTGRQNGAVGTVMGNAAPDSDYVRVKVGSGGSKLYHPSDLTPASTGPFSGHQFDVKQDALGLKPGQYRVTDYTANETSFGNFSRVTVRNLNSGLMTTIPVGNAQMMGLLPMGDGMPEKPKTKKFFKAETVSDELGMVFGWAIVCKEDGADYFDSQDDHITEKAMLGAAVDFMENSRVMKEMHAGEEQGSVVFAWPLTEDIAKAMGIETQKTGLMIAVKPGNPEILEKFKTGEYSGFSIGGTRLTDEVVKEE